MIMRGKSYIIQTRRVIEIRIKEHEKGVDFKRTEKSVVAEHAEQNGHNIHFNKAKILTKEQNCGKRMIKEAIEIGKCPAN